MSVGRLASPGPRLTSAARGARVFGWLTRENAVLSLFLLLPFLYFHRLTLAGEVLFWGTPLLQFFPWRAYAVQEYLAGRVPLWNPYAGMGAPLAANLQSAVFYPLNVPYLLLPFERAVTLALVLHLALAGWATWALLRRLGANRGGALIAACAFMFSGFVVAQAAFLSMTSTVAWLPAVFLCLHECLSAPSRRWAVALALSVAMLLLSGHIQVAYYALLLAAGYLAWRMAAAAIPLLLGRHPGHRSAEGMGENAGEIAVWLPASGCALLGLALGAALAALQLVPSWELTRESVRASGLQYADAVGYSLFPGQLITALAPTFFGSQPGGDWWGPGPPWEGVIYTGLLPLLLALLAVLRGRPRGTVLFFLAAGLAGLFLATGRYNPVFPFFFDHLPGLSLFHAPSRFVLWYVFAIAVLSGLGWTALTEGPPGTGRALGRLAAAAGAALVLLVVVLQRTIPGLFPVPSVGESLLTGAGWLCLSGALIAGVAHGVRKNYSGALPALAGLALTFSALFMYGRDLNPSTNLRLYGPVATAHPAAAAGPDQGRLLTTDRAYAAVVDRLFPFSRFHTSEWEVLAEARTALTPNLATVHGVQEVHNYDPLKLSRSTRLRLAAEGRPPGEAELLLDMMGVRFLAGAAAGRDDEGLRVVDRGRRFLRAYLAARATPVPDQEAAFRVVTGPDFDPRREAVVEVPGSDATPATFPGAGPREAQITGYTPARVVVETDGGGGLLVLFDAYYPGWKARIDGREAQVWPANAAFRGVFLLPGERTVEFLYQPAGFIAGLAVSGAAALLAAALLLVRR